MKLHHLFTADKIRLGVKAKTAESVIKIMVVALAEIYAKLDAVEITDGDLRRDYSELTV